MSHAIVRQGAMHVTPPLDPLMLSPFMWSDASREAGPPADGVKTNVTDLSPNGRTLVGATPSINNPTYKTGIVNGRAVYRADGLATVVHSLFTLSQPCFVFLVLRVVTVAITKNFCDGGTLNAMIIQSDNSSGLGSRGYAGSFLTAAPLASWAAFHTIGVLFNGAGSEIRLDGGGLVSGNIGTATPGGFSLFGDANGGSLAQVDVAAAGVFPLLTATQRQNLEAAARTKWGTP